MGSTALADRRPLERERQIRPKRHQSALAVAAVAAFAALALAGCGGSNGGSSTTAASGGSTTSTAQGGGGSAVKVGETEFKLNPSNPTVNAGQVTFDVSNDGQVLHSLEVEGPNGEQKLPSDLSPGQSGTLSVDLSKPGKYAFYCPVDSHKQMGMKGTITVK
jgi:uncharacterized cupredoxin-like copper-binding protein